MQQKDNTLYAFLKKNAAYSTAGYPSSRIVSDLKTTMPDIDKNHSFNTSSTQNNFQHISNQQYQNSFNNSNNTHNNIHSDTNFRRNDYRNKIYVQEGDDNQSIKSFNSNTSSIRTTSSNFESARNQAQYCLNNLSDVIRKQINNIDHKLESFNKDVLMQLKEHAQTFRKRVIWMIEQAFRENQRHLMEIQRFQQQKMAGELIQIKQILERQYVKVQVMRGEIKRSNWKKVAGQILSSQLEERVMQLVERSERVHVRAPSWDEKTDQSLRYIQEIVKQCIKLQ